MPSSSTRTPLHPRKLGIPIHDPHDDIDSDTPIYKSEENNAPDRGAVLGSLSDTRHEDLMEELYGPFQLPPPKKRQRRVHGKCRPQVILQHAYSCDMDAIIELNSAR